MTGRADVTQLFLEALAHAREHARQTGGETLVTVRADRVFAWRCDPRGYTLDSAQSTAAYDDVVAEACEALRKLPRLEN